MRVDRYLVVKSDLPDTEDYLLIDCLYRQVIATGDSGKELQRQAKEKRKADDAPIAQRHRR